MTLSPPTDCAIAHLRQQIHDDLRMQHPEWVLPNGESPTCDAYEARLMDQLALVPGSPSDAPTDAAHHSLERRRDDLRGV
jgi:hypothetical protein